MQETAATEELIHQAAGPPFTNVGPEEFSRWIWGCGPRDRAAQSFFDPREKLVHFVECTRSPSAGQLQKIRPEKGHAINRIPGMLVACRKCNVHRHLNELSRPQPMHQENQTEKNVERRKQRCMGDPLRLELLLAKNQKHEMKNMLFKKIEVDLPPPLTTKALKKLCARKFKDFKPKTGRIFAVAGAGGGKGKTVLFSRSRKMLEITNEDTLYELEEYYSNANNAIQPACESATQARARVRIVLSGKSGWSMDPNTPTAPHAASISISTSANTDSNGNRDCNINSSVSDQKSISVEMLREFYAKHDPANVSRTVRHTKHTSYTIPIISPI